MSSGKQDAGSSVDVAATLRALKSEVRRQRHDLHGDAALAASEWQDAVNLDVVQNTSRVNPHLPIAWPEWPPGILPKIAALLQKVTRRLLRWYVTPIVQQQNEFNAAVAQALADILVELRAGDARAEQQLHTASEDLQHALTREREAQKREHDILSQRLWRLEQRRPLPAEEQTASEDSPRTTRHAPRTTPDYYHFELRHRGSPDDIAERQSTYLDYFRGCRHVLDVGCGRGEFVSLLRAHGVDARGVDLDPDMVAHCQAEGLPVVQADAVAHLRTLADDSLDGVFMAQVVEHLTPASLLELLRLCQQKLAPGGVCVAETINPTCVYAFVQYYLMDVSHVQPLHPETLRFMLEDAGFWRTEIKFLAPVPAEQRLSELPADGLGAEQAAVFNHNVERLNELLFGYQDYAVIARRPPDTLPESDVAT